MMNECFFFFFLVTDLQKYKLIRDEHHCIRINFIYKIPY